MSNDPLPADSRRVIASMLCSLRRTSRLSQRDLAARLARTQALVSKVEAGKIGLDVIELRRWLAVLDVSFVEFVEQLDGKLQSVSIAAPEVDLGEAVGAGKDGADQESSGG